MTEIENKTDFEKLLELMGIDKLSPEKQRLARSILKKMIADYHHEKSEGSLMKDFFEVMCLGKLDEATQAELREHTWNCIKSKACINVKDYNFNFGCNGIIKEALTTGADFAGPDSPKIGDLYTRKKDAYGIFHQEPMPKKQSDSEKKIENQLQKIKYLFNSRNSSKSILGDIKKILQNESSPTTSTFSHSQWSSYRYVKMTKDFVVIHSNTYLASPGTKLTSQKIDDLKSMGVQITISESLNEAYQANDSILDDLTYQELLDTVYSNIEFPDEKSIMREFEKIVKTKVNDAKQEIKRAVKQIIKDLKE